MNQQESEVDFEAQAKEDGWSPQSEWNGDPAKWITAEEFVKRGEKILPLVNAKLRKERERTAKLEADVSELREGNKQFLQFHEQTLAKERKERDAVIAQLEAERKKAITDGDGDAFDRADKKLQEARTTPPPKPAGPSPDMQAWLVENPWYTTDKKMQKIADGLSDVLAEENPTLKGRAFLDKLAELVKVEMPHKFQNARREASTTESHERKTPSKTGRTYEDLPADAKASCDKFIKTIPGFSKEKYLAHYDWRQQ
jgi:hypothetical protein